MHIKRWENDYGVVLDVDQCPFVFYVEGTPHRAALVHTRPPTDYWKNSLLQNKLMLILLYCILTITTSILSGIVAGNFVTGFGAFCLIVLVSSILLGESLDEFSKSVYVMVRLHFHEKFNDLTGAETFLANKDVPMHSCQSL